MLKNMLSGFLGIFVLNVMISLGEGSWSFFMRNNALIAIVFLISFAIVGIISNRKEEEKEWRRRNRGMNVYRSRR